jgi:hypothetical protein
MATSACLDRRPTSAGAEAFGVQAPYVVSVARDLLLDRLSVVLDRLSVVQEQESPITPHDHGIAHPMPTASPAGTGWVTESAWIS